MDATVKVLDNPKTLDLIATKIFEAYEQHLADTSVLNILEAERDNIRKALKNMLNIVEMGIITSSTKQRIKELKAQLEVAESKVLVGKSKSEVQLTPNDIKKFINNALKKEPLVMIRLLVNKIVLYDDKVEVYYNCINRKRPDDLAHQAFCIYTEEFDVNPQYYGLNYNAMGCKFLLE